ncbi:MAG TPA: hypothetical protein VFX53_17040 [Pedococcus sp.]|nr:hypothetical protein [Pedococcus sp.]
MTTSWRVPRLSTEWVGPIAVTRNGAVVTDWTVAIFPRIYQPTLVSEIDEEPSTLDGGLGVLIGPGTDHVLTPGLYKIWVRYVDTPEAPVLDNVGLIQIT